MSKQEYQDPKLFLGVDGGQSHTEALIADREGNILGRGFGGASNHAEIPGGRERLRNAVSDSVGEALQKKINVPIEKIVFESAHFGMTGGADFKREIIENTVNARILNVGHDAPTALYGATAGKPGIVVISGTGSVVFGQNVEEETVRAGGLGYLFSDEGSGFWLAAQIIRLAVKEEDGLFPDQGLQKIAKDFFKVEKMREITDAFYNGKISRDEIAKLSRKAQEAAAAGNEILESEIKYGCDVLVKQVKTVAEKLRFSDDFLVCGIGGMFNGKIFRETFAAVLSENVSRAKFKKPVFGPAIGSLLTAYRAAEVKITDTILNNLEQSQN